MTSSRTLCDSSGSPITLRREIGRGGEGAVFEVDVPTESVAKLYHAAIPDAKLRKLVGMTELVDDRLLLVAAWPSKLLFDRRGGDCVGFLMPSVTSWPNVHALYSPADRKRRFPDLHWSFLIHTARNLASAFETLHARSVVVGDVNGSNLVVHPKTAKARFVDCDSFQIPVRGSLERCGVGVEHFTPPELHGRSFESVDRTSNHDAFGLAVLCFHLLMMGRHPFAGRYTGVGDMPIEKAIREFRFAYGAMARGRRMLPPPDTLPLESLGPGIARLFDAAFSEEGVRKRPTATEWLKAIETLERNLRRCTIDAAHEFRDGLSRCPWCDLDRRSIVFFVGTLARAASTAHFDLAAVWAAINTVSFPSLPSLPTTVPVMSPPEKSRLTRARLRFGNVPVVVALVFVATFAMVGVGAFPDQPWMGGVLPATLLAAYLLARYGARADRETRRSLTIAKKKWREANERWKVVTAPQRFNDKRTELARAKDEFERVSTELGKELSALEATKRQTQLAAFLSRHRIDRASISGIGTSRVATLASYGIETAADIDYWRVFRVPGFGEKRAGDLVAWRSTIESLFVFNPRTQIPESLKTPIRAKFEAQLARPKQFLSSGALALQAIRADAIRDAAAIVAEAREVARTYADALAKLTPVPDTIIFLPGAVRPPSAGLPSLNLSSSTATRSSPAPPRPQAATAPTPPPIRPTTTTRTPGPTCPQCGAALEAKNGRYGPFWGCSNYRTTRRCRYTRNR